MQRLTIITILSLTSLISINCGRSKTVAELMVTFSLNKPKLNAIVNNIQRDKILDSLFSNIGAENGIPDIKKTYPEQYEMLREVGITDASAHAGTCEIDKKNRPTETLYEYNLKHKWYYFKTNWQADHPIFLMYNECDTAKTHKGFYNKDENQNETWGLGDNWIMFRLVKYIEVKQ
ncbi:MAG TPA: hypothetical protein PLP23_13550 [Panacibacter sp.]|nr:hypothetical protein [Panacibacter sp.]